MSGFMTIDTARGHQSVATAVISCVATEGIRRILKKWITTMFTSLRKLTKFLNKLIN